MRTGRRRWPRWSSAGTRTFWTCGFRILTAHPYLRHTLNAAEALAREVGHEKLVVGAVIGPFSLPTMLMGMRKFLALIDDAELRERYFQPLMTLMVEFAARWARAQMEAGCHMVVFAEGIASATIVDEATFLKYARPVMERFVQRVAGDAGDARGVLALEFVGHGLPYMHHVRDLNVAGFLIGESDTLVEARAAYRAREGAHRQHQQFETAALGARASAVRSPAGGGPSWTRLHPVDAGTRSALPRSVSRHRGAGPGGHRVRATG